MAHKVSFIVTIYNVGKYIERCVRSLFEQSLDDIEVVFVNDATPDDSMEIIERVLEDYPRRKEQVRIVTHETNKGIAETRKDGFLNVTGDYFIYIDGDDYVEPQMAELMYDKAISEDADLVVCEVRVYNADGFRIVTQVPNGIEGDGQNVKDDIINRSVVPGLWCKLTKRALFVENEIVWPTHGYGEDIILSTQMAYYAKRIASVNVPLYHYCYNAGSFCNEKSEAQLLSNFYDFKANLDLVCAFLKDKGLEERYENGIFLNKIRTKMLLNRLIGQRKYRKLWVRTYPEVNRSFLFGDKYRKPSYRERFWIIAMSIGLYPKYRRRIYSKRFKPRDSWQPTWT